MHLANTDALALSMGLSI